MSKTLIFGASGTVGSTLAKLITEKGETVLRATSRAAEAADQVEADLVSGKGVAEAVGKAEKLFLLAPPGHTRQDLLLKPVIDAAAAKPGIRRVVLMTAFGANAVEEAPFRQVELHLERSGLPWTVIRPNWFMQNFNSYWVDAIRRQGKILLSAGRGKASFIDARDIAAVAASLLTRDDLAGQAFDLTGPEALDHDEVAAILSKETGRDIRYEDITPEAMEAGLLAAGLPADYAAFMIVILTMLKAGYASPVTPHVEAITGTAPRRFVDYARDHRQAWLV
jgi:uncharacterized protein YbjT (DUF2867 family)